MLMFTVPLKVALDIKPIGHGLLYQDICGIFQTVTAALDVGDSTDSRHSIRGVSKPYDFGHYYV